MRWLLNHKGQAALEGALALPFWLLFVGTLLVASYFLAARVTLDRQAYEALICLAESQPALQCEHRMRQAIHHWLTLGSVHHLKLIRSANRYSIELHWGLTDTLQLRLHKALPFSEVKR